LNAKEAAGVLRGHESFVIMSHSDPDGDSIGSQLALASALRRIGKTAWAVADERTPAIYSFLEGSVHVEPPAAGASADVVVVVDSSNEQRVSGLDSIGGRERPILNIDHHRSNTRFGRWNYVDADACACAEQIYGVILELGGRLTREEAANLYVGIMTDTGAFRFPNTTSRSLHVAAELVDLGIPAAEIARKVYWEKTPESTHLLGMALSSLEIVDGGRIASMVISREMSRRACASASDSDGFASYTKVISGVKVGLLFRQLDGDGVRVSLRSDSGVDVERVARRFGGGGHPTSAGCVVEGPMDDVRDAVTREVVRLLHEQDG
jgi:phosphoesterase RecJ-like protein